MHRRQHCCEKHGRPHRHGAIFWCLAIGAGLFFVTSCVPLGGTRYWHDSDETHTLPTVGTRRVSIKATNGYVQVRAARPGADTIEVHALLRGGGNSETDASDCLHALEVAMPINGGDEATQEITWAWREPKQSHWTPAVSFEVVMPVDLELIVETDNGKVDVVGVAGDCDVKTVNGDVRVVAAKHQLTAKTSNGSLTVESPAEKVDLRSVNGRVEATLFGDNAIAGSVATTNGSVEVRVSPDANVELRSSTTNGRVKSKLALKDVERGGKTRLVGHLGQGSGKLDVRTTNGDIDLKPYAP